MNSIPEYVTIKQSDYQRLLERDFKLECLEVYGVGNWEGYDEAMREYHNQEDN